MQRQASYARMTNETDIEIGLGLDGAAGFSGASGIGFLDHLLSALARHGGLRLTLRCAGDLHVDGHHTAEDIGLCLGEALALALGEMRGIERFGDAAVPMDEALACVAMDISGRPYLALACDPLPPMIGDLDSQLIEEFLRAFAQKARLTLHADARGSNGHHIAEALFKALGRAIKKAVAVTDATGAVPSTKGVL